MDKINEKIYCKKCRINTNHGILAKHEENFPAENGFVEEEVYMISICLGCDTVNFVVTYTNSSMIRYFGPDDDDNEQIYDYIVFPSQPKEETIYLNSHRERAFNNLPEMLQVLYHEVIIAYNSQMYLLAAIGLRMLVEGVCKDLDIKDGPVLDQETGNNKCNDKGEEVRSKNLVGQINGMIEKGVIVQTQARILHEIRDLGNQTAHELIRPKEKIILSAITIIEDILHVIYELEKFSIKGKEQKSIH